MVLFLDSFGGGSNPERQMSIAEQHAVKEVFPKGRLPMENVDL